MRPARKRELARIVQENYDVSERHACGLIQVQRGTFRYQHHGRDDTVLRMRIKELAKTYIRHGYKRIYTLLMREGFKVNHKRVYRIYCEEELSLRTKKKKKRVSHARGFEHKRAMDHGFRFDRLEDGRRVRALTVLDMHIRESLAIISGFSLTVGLP